MRVKGRVIGLTVRKTALAVLGVVLTTSKLNSACLSACSKARLMSNAVSFP